MRFVIPLYFFALLTIGLSAKQPVEVGLVQWTRDHDRALELSEETGKPVFALFQEVPGCAGCQAFGKKVLSNKALVEVIEDSFVPLLIYNNRGGKDAQLLKQYGEPSWNYQVVRFLDAEGQDIISRKDRIWDIKALSKRMVQVLEAKNKAVPSDLWKLSGQSPKAKKAASATETIAISQYCFWTGERVIGSIEGVVETEAGFLNGHEVTKVIYQPDTVSPEAILKRAKSERTGDQLYTDLTGYRKARASDQKKQIQGTAFQKITMTNAQATKVNAFARSDPKKALEYLSPEQITEL